MNTTFEEVGLPTPKFKIGQIVFATELTPTTAEFPCPDCCGERKWKLTTPSGHSYEVPCQRCGQTFSDKGLSLRYQTYEGGVRTLTIGSVRIDTTPNSWGDSPIKYMCCETGIGSGTVWDETKLFADCDEAKIVADVEITAKLLEISEKPATITQQRLAGLYIPEVGVDVAHSSIWNAWYSYRQLRDDLAGILEDEGLRGDALREAVQSVMDWERDYRDVPLLGILLDAAAKAVDGDAEPLKSTLAAIPDEFRELAKRSADPSLRIPVMEKGRTA